MPGTTWLFLVSLVRFQPKSNLSFQCTDVANGSHLVMSIHEGVFRVLNGVNVFSPLQQVKISVTSHLNWLSDFFRI